MIRIYLGKLGSGKTLHAVKNVIDDNSSLNYYTNFTCKSKHSIQIGKEEIVKEIEVTSGKKTKLEFKLNWEYWRAQDKPLHIIWDEIHLTANSRTSMSKMNMIIMEFVAMARRICGMDAAGYGSLTFIAQTDFSIEKYIRHLANEIVYHIMYWTQQCDNCRYSDVRNSEALLSRKCRSCRSEDTVKKNFFCVTYTFKTFLDYEYWASGHPGKWYVKRDVIMDIEEYFDKYDTHQEISS